MKPIKFIAVFMVFSAVIFTSSCTPKEVPVETNKIATEAEVAALYEGLKNNENLILKKRTYYLDRPIVVSSQSIFTLDGNGATLIMKNKDEDVILVEYCEVVTLKNFKATHIEPEGPVGCTGSVIQVRNSADISIENCELNGSGIIGVVAYETNDLKVRNNYIYNNSKYGILYDLDCTVEITGNRFEDNGDNGDFHVGKALDSGLSQVEKIEGDRNENGLIMSKNKYQ